VDKKKTGKPVLFVAARGGLATVVQVKLDRVRGHANAVDFVHLQFDEGIDPVVGEDTALGQELAVLVQGSQGLFQRGADGRRKRVYPF
jgi:hypothetical protein